MRTVEQLERYELRGQQGRDASRVRWVVQGDRLLCFTGEQYRFGLAKASLSTLPGLASFIRTYSERRFSWLSKSAIADLLDLLARQGTT